jgi:hypothetical protein
MIENWKDIIGYENLYEVSDIGNVRRKSNKRILSPRIDKDGYKRVTLSKDSKAKSFLVHRLVAIAFIENPHLKETVNHKDKNTSNNELSNLEWLTRQENLEHGKKNGNNVYKYLNEDEVKNIRYRNSGGEDFYSLAKFYGVSYTTIYNIVSRKGRYAKM